MLKAIKKAYSSNISANAWFIFYSCGLQHFKIDSVQVQLFQNFVHVKRRSVAKGDEHQRSN